MSTVDPQELCGWVPEPEKTKRYDASLPYPRFEECFPNLMAQATQRDILLLEDLIAVSPNWKREKQTIGDCFHPDTLVLGEKDTKPIKDVNVGDKIFNGKGTLTTVISKQVKISSQPLITIHTTGGIPLVVTSDHQVLAYRFPFREKKGKGRITRALYEREKNGVATKSKNVLTLWEERKAEWVKASELRESDYLLTPLEYQSKEKPDHPLLQTEEGLWAFGYFLGNGHASGGTVEFAVPVSKKSIGDRLVKVLLDAGFDPKKGSYYKECEAFRICVGNRELVRWFRSVCYGHDKLKLMQSWAIGNESILEGLIDADGFRGKDKITFDSVSPSLVFGVRASLIMQGYDATVSVVSRSGGSYPTKRKLYRVIAKSNRQREYLWRDDRWLCHPIRKIEIEEGPHEVYDIGVSHKDHSFIANGYTVHNCVSHGGTICATVLEAQMARLGLASFIAPAASEALYGLRVEADNQGSWSDGWYGAGQAKALHEYGVCLRLDYSTITGNKEHDLRVYSGDKAKQWGYYGCGGKGDEGKLDAIAKQKPIQEVTKVKNTKEAAAAIDAGCTISICSDVGFENGSGQNGEMTMRDSTGVARRRRSWAHCMAILGVRWVDNKPQFRICNSWGHSVGGPDPGVTSPAISDCSWWATEEDVQDILEQDDSYAFSRIAGFELPPYDFINNILV